MFGQKISKAEIKYIAKDYALGIQFFVNKNLLDVNIPVDFKSIESKYPDLPGWFMQSLAELETLTDELEDYKNLNIKIENKTIALPWSLILGDNSNNKSKLPQAREIIPTIMEKINLPQQANYKIKMQSKGTFDDKDFKVKWKFTYTDNSIVDIDKRTGAFIEEINGSNYLLSSEMYKLCNALQKEWPSETNERMLHWANIKPLTGKDFVRHDPYLMGEDAVPVEKIKPVLKMNEDGDLQVNVEADKVSSSELTGKVDKFIKTPDFFNLDTEQDGRKRVVLSEAAKKGINKIKERRKITGYDAPKALVSPEDYFDPDIFDLSLYSERVTGIGDYIYRPLPYVRSVKNDKGWFEWDSGINLNSADTLGTEKNKTGKHKKEEDSLDDCEENFIKFSDLSDEKKEEYENAINEAINNESQFVRIDNKWINTDPEKLLKMLKSADHAVEKAKKSSPKKQVLKIFENIEDLEFDKNEFSEDENCKHIEAERPPGLVENINLFPYQKNGLSWLLWLSGKSNKTLKGGLLADDMGLGKTLQLLSLLAFKSVESQHSPSLILAPVSLLKNWNDELQKFFPDLIKKVIKIKGGKKPVTPEQINEYADMLKNYELILCSYETFRDRQFAFAKVDWKFIICDEAQKIKNPSTRVSIAVKSLKAKMRIACTGTPVENGLSELWNLMDFSVPGLLGSLKHFYKNFALPLETNEESIRQSVRDELKKVINPVFLRRTKADVLTDLPQKNKEYFEINMSNLQKQMYGEYINLAKGPNKKPAIAILQYLLAISSHPRLMLSKDIGIEQLISESPKLKITMDILEKIEKKDEKVIIFTRLKEMQKLLVRCIGSIFKINAHVINGSVTSSEKRLALIEQFLEKKGFNAMILGPRAAGVGLNIVSANHVIHYTREWNPAIEAQATDRAYRIGQIKDVTVYYPISTLPGITTVEQRLNDLLVKKEKLMNDFMQPKDFFTIKPKEILEGITSAKTVDYVSEEINWQAVTELMDKKQFEKLIAALWIKKGYKTALLNKYGNYGADVIAFKEDSVEWLIQVNFTKDNKEELNENKIIELLSAENFYRDKYKKDIKVFS